VLGLDLGLQLDRDQGQPAHHLVGRRRLIDAPLEMTQGGLQGSGVEGILAPEVAVEGRRGDAEVTRDVLQARPRIPALVEAPSGGGEDGRTSIPRSRPYRIHHVASLSQAVHETRRRPAVGRILDGQRPSRLRA
jgi:hypothetical protein